MTPFFHDEGFEKPRGVRQVPFRRTDVGHGLHDAIFGLEISTQRVGELSDLMKALAQARDPGFARGEKRSIRRRRCGRGFNGGRAQGISPSRSRSSRRASSI